MSWELGGTRVWTGDYQGRSYQAIADQLGLQLPEPLEDGVSMGSKGPQDLLQGCPGSGLTPLCQALTKYKQCIHTFGCPLELCLQGLEHTVRHSHTTVIPDPPPQSLESFCLPCPVQKSGYATNPLSIQESLHSHKDSTHSPISWPPTAYLQLDNPVVGQRPRCKALFQVLQPELQPQQTKM